LSNLQKKPSEPSGGEAIIKGIDRKIPVGSMAAYPGNSPSFWGKGKFFLGWRLMALRKDVSLEHRVVMLIILLDNYEFTDESK